MSSFDQNSHEMLLVEYNEPSNTSLIQPKFKNRKSVPNRYPHGICSIHSANYIDIQPRSKREFDRLNVPVKSSGWKYDPIATHDRGNDGEWQSRVLTKQLYCGDIQIIVRWFDVRMIMDNVT